MKRLLFIAALALMMGAAQESMAQQRKTTVRKSAVKRTTASKNAVKKAVTPPVTITIDDPVIVDGCVAFLGIPVNQSPDDIEKQVKAKGFVDKMEYGFNWLVGTAFGTQMKMFVEAEGGVTAREVKAYTFSQAKNRVNAYKKAFVQATGGKSSDDCMGCQDGGGTTIETVGGTIEIRYYNQDEVNFESKYYDIVVSFSK